MKRKKNSGFLRLNWQDLIKGLIMAAGGAAFVVIQTSFESGGFIFEWTKIWQAAAMASVVYLFKQLLTPTPTVIEYDPDKTQVKEITK